MAGNDDLHRILSKIHQTIGDVLKQVRNVAGKVEEVREAITDGVETIQEAIHDNIRAQAELRMIEHVANVEAIVPQIDAEEDRIGAEEDELDERLESIDERYARRHDELDDKAAERVRDLGSHIFEIDESQFEDGVEKRFTDHVTTAWSSFQTHHENVENERREEIETATGDTVEAIHEFLNQQEELLETIDQHRTDADALDGSAETIQVPYYVVTVRQGGQTEEHVVVPSDIRSQPSPFGAQLDPFPGLTELISPTETSNERHETVRNTSLVRAGASAVGHGPPMLSYNEALEASIGDSLSVVVDGGAD